jgi:hypothetical protein
MGSCGRRAAPRGIKRRFDRAWKHSLRPMGIGLPSFLDDMGQRLVAAGWVRDRCSGSDSLGLRGCRASPWLVGLPCGVMAPQPRGEQAAVSYESHYASLSKTRIRLQISSFLGFLDALPEPELAAGPGCSGTHGLALEVSQMLGLPRSVLALLGCWPGVMARQRQGDACPVANAAVAVGIGRAMPPADG